MSEEEVIPVFVPPLVALLARAEQLKGQPLTEAEVVRIRDQGTCMTMSVEHARALAERRGYDDLDPERAWEEWQVVRRQIAESQAEGSSPAG